MITMIGPLLGILVLLIGACIIQLMIRRGLRDIERKVKKMEMWMLYRKIAAIGGVPWLN